MTYYTCVFCGHRVHACGTHIEEQFNGHRALPYKDTMMAARADLLAKYGDTGLGALEHTRDIVLRGNYRGRG